jgi:uncharacterized phage protein gp47/JayE
MSESFFRPTIRQLIAQVKAGFEANLTGADLALRRSNLGVTAIMVAGALDAEYGYQDWTIDNALMPDTAIAPYSTRWGALKGASPNPPGAATGAANFANCLPNIDIPSETLLQLQPGIVFQTSADANTGSGGAVTNVPVAAVLPSVTSDGSEWNCDAGASLTLVQAIGGIDGDSITVAADVSNGTAPETNAAFQARYLQLFRQPPQGGDLFDYVEWALEVPGVTRAWCQPLGMGPGTVVVYVMLDQAEAAFGGLPQGSNGVASGETRATPATGDQLTVANYIFIGRFAVKGAVRPVTALVYVIAPTLVPQNFILKYVPTAQQMAVAEAISNVLVTEGQAVSINFETGLTSGGTVDLGDIQAAVRAVPQCAAALVLSPTDNIITSIGQLPVLSGPTTAQAGTCAFVAIGNTGNGIVSAVAVGSGASAGNYGIALTSATAFAVTSPAGASLGSGVVGTPFTGGGLTFTVTAGSVAYVAGDGFTVSVQLT